MAPTGGSLLLFNAAGGSWCHLRARPPPPHTHHRGTHRALTLISKGCTVRSTSYNQPLLHAPCTHPASLGSQRPAARRTLNFEVASTGPPVPSSPVSLCFLHHLPSSSFSSPLPPSAPPSISFTCTFGSAISSSARNLRPACSPADTFTSPSSGFVLALHRVVVCVSSSRQCLALVEGARQFRYPVFSQLKKEAWRY